MRYLTLLFLSIFILACQPGTTVDESQQTTTSTTFQADLSNGAAWSKDQLRLVPITAFADFISNQAPVAKYSVLSEILQNEHFRISEKKPYGRFDDSGAVNTLTVQNKTEKTVLLLAGDVVQGGNQDRVIGEDRVIAARSIEDIPVFCVEHGRWMYNEDNALNESDKKIFAFRGYYNMASNAIRKSVRRGNQGEVWENVATITSQQDVTSNTDAYAALDNNDEFANKRLGYQRFFEDKLEGNTNIVGFIALSGNTIIGTDIMGHPELLNRQFKALVNSYATDAILINNTSEIPEQTLQSYVNNILTKVASKDAAYYKDGLLVHFEDLK